MKHIFTLFLMLFSITTLNAHGGKKPCGCKPIVAENAVIKAIKVGTSTGKMNTAGYATFTNKKDFPIQITSVTFAEGQAAFCESIEMHTHNINGDKAEMMKVDSFTVPAKGKITLQMGKDHLMFMKLKNDIEPNTEINLVFSIKWTTPEGEMKTKDIPVSFKILSQEVIEAMHNTTSSDQSCCDKK